MNDTPIAVVLLLLLGAAVWIVRQVKTSKVPDPGAPSGQQYIPLSPTCVDPERRWLVLPSQEV